MTLIENILQKVQSVHSNEFLSKYSKRYKYVSPPPEIDETFIEKVIRRKKKKKTVNRYPHVVSRVDSSAPPYHAGCMYRNIATWTRDLNTLYAKNFELVTRIKRQHWTGKVDCHRKQYPKLLKEYYEKRRDFLKRVETQNKVVYERLMAIKPRVKTTASLQRFWRHQRREIISRAALPFVLFPPKPSDNIDPVFQAAPGVRRPRVRISMRVAGAACLGTLTLELFTDVCPKTCQLFAELLRGDGLGHTYIGTCFFRKVPGLYWSGGDVIHDNGFGCYMQRGRLVPIGAENYHYPHSMPGLVSMRVTMDNEICGIFNITFKPLPQFDLKNVVFGRVIRPSSTYEILSTFGSPFSTYPVVRIESARFLQPTSPLLADTEECARQQLEHCLPTADGYDINTEHAQ